MYFPLDLESEIQENNAFYTEIKPIVMLLWLHIPGKLSLVFFYPQYYKKAKGLGKTVYKSIYLWKEVI